MAAAAARKLQKDIEVVLKKGPFVAMAVENGQVEKNMGNNGTKIKDLCFHNISTCGWFCFLLIPMDSQSSTMVEVQVCLHIDGSWCS